jgi:UDP-3-O-[3-hydroxymyristoyl] glucosamine N-acyltransferase
MRVQEMAELLCGTLRGDGKVEITGARDLAGARPGDVSFVQEARYLGSAVASKAAAFLVPAGLEVPGKPCVEVPNPKAAFVMMLSRFLPAPQLPRGVSSQAMVSATVAVPEDAFIGPGAVVDDGVIVGRGARIGALCYVGASCRLGAGAVLHPHVTLYPGTVVGERTIVHSGTVLGADGFGYLQARKAVDASGGGASERYSQVEGEHVKVPQLGRVVVGDDVEIGACVSVDRATLGETIIGRGTKIDNQVQIGHNVRIGEHVLIVAEVGIAGSTKIGDHVTIGGNCGISEGVDIGAFCIVGAHSLVFPGKRFPPRTVILGNPAREARRTREQMTAMSGLPKLVREVVDLKQRLTAMERERGSASR